MNFDTPAERKGTNSIKWDSQAIANIASNPEAEPFWVADMDFLPEEHIRKAGMALSDLGVYGYPAFHSRLEDAAAGWLGKKHGWNVDPGALTFAMGMLHGIASVLDLFTEPGDKVLVPSPMYRPFREIVQNNRRVLVEFPLSYRGGSFSLDKERFSSAMDGVKCILFCSPQNPSGIVFTHDELSFVLEEAARHDALVISDEIHSDLVHPGATHIPMGKANEDIGARCATFFAPSKTFNIPGLISSWCVIKNKELRQGFYDWLAINELNEPTFTVTVATEAAYNQGESWLNETLAYLEGNILALEEFVKEHLPCIKVMRPQASYLIWLDCTELGLKGQELDQLFIDAGLALNDGEMFGDGGEYHQRINIGCSRSVIIEALKRLERTIAQRK